MNERRTHEFDSPTQAQRIDKVCDRFEAAWRAGHEPRIEDYLGDRGDWEGSAGLGEPIKVEPEYGTRRAYEAPANIVESSQTPTLQAALLRELLELELHYRRERGEQPSPDEYRGRFPE